MFTVVAERAIPAVWASPAGINMPVVIAPAVMAGMAAVVLLVTAHTNILVLAHTNWQVSVHLAGQIYELRL